MGRGSSKVSGGAGGNVGVIGSHSVPGQPNVRTSGDITFSEMMAISSSSISDGTITFDRITTMMPKGQVPTTGKKNDLATMLSDSGMKRMVVNMYRDRSGANDLNRLFGLGYQIQAQYKGADTGSRIPPRDYYFMVKQ